MADPVEIPVVQTWLQPMVSGHGSFPAEPAFLRKDFDFERKYKLIPVNTPEFYYHVTSQVWTDQVALKPIHSVAGNRSKEELTVPRICVSDSIWGCLLAIACCLRSSEFVFVYKTCEPMIAYYPKMVGDSCITRERWLLGKYPGDMQSSYPFQKVLSIAPNSKVMIDLSELMSDLSLGDPQQLKAQKKASDKARKLFDKQMLPKYAESPAKLWHKGKLLDIKGPATKLI